MIRHDDWSTPGLDLEPVAPATGPFPRRAFLQTLSGEHVELFEGFRATFPVVVSGGVVRCAGDPELTDYHSPLGDGVADLVAGMAETFEPGTRFEFDSLPVEASEPVAKGLAAAGVETRVEPHALTAVLDLPDTFEDYLADLGKKQRHEVRRKRRRYIEEVGEVVFESHVGTGWAFDEFIRLHRRSSGPKGHFMTDGHAAWFSSLAGSPGWRIDLLRIPGREQAAACLFVYVDADGVFLYNSAYDPDLAAASPGVVMVEAAIEHAVGRGRLDFLKGDETYKFRLGARERTLFRVSGVR